MIDGSPSLLGRPTSLLGRSRSPGFERFVERHATDRWYYGSGKAALRDGLSPVADTGDNALVPAYLPDAVPEPLSELGLEVRRYAIRPDLGADVDDLRTRVDEDTVAIVSVNYFGLANPSHEAIASVAGEYGCLHVDDAAHAGVSVVDGRLVGTRGDLGFSSLRKLLPVPNGAILFVSNEALAERFEPSPLAGTRNRFDADDARFVLKSIALEAATVHPAIRRFADALASAGGRDADVPDPTQRYEASKVPLSKLSAAVLSTVDPGAVRRRRRAHHRAWRDALTDRDELSLVHPSLQAGVCPLACPVIATDPDRFLRELETADVRGAYRWPRLPAPVRGDPDYETARGLADHLIALPVHQDLSVDEIAAAAGRLDRSANGTDQSPAARTARVSDASSTR